MKLYIISDLHLEFEPFSPPENIEADVVVLAGDISVDERGIIAARQWFPNIPILYVPGNHEYYHKELHATNRRLQEVCRQEDVTLLNPGVFQYQGYLFIGATLWTDFALYGEQMNNMFICEGTINDYHYINVQDGGQSRKLSADDSLKIHKEHRQYIEAALSQYQGKRVVITHHLPSEKSVQDRFLYNRVTAGFASSLDEVIKQYTPDLWIHGHSHHCVDYMIDSTRIVSNQKGYPGEETGFRKDLVVSI